MAGNGKPGNSTPSIKGIIKSPTPLHNRLFIAVGLTGLIRAEWAMARYGQVVPCNWQQLEFPMWLDQCAPMGYMVADMRNLAVREFINRKMEWMIFIDHDVLLPIDFYVKLNERIIKEKIPVWSGLYFTKSYPSEPLVYRERGKGFFADWKMGDMVWVSAVPMGCTLIHNSILKVCWDEAEEYNIGPERVRRVFESPRKVWQDSESMSWEVLTGTEDLKFCWDIIENDRFKKAGWPKFAKKKYPFLCDTSIFCRHITNDGVMYPSAGEEQYFSRKAK
jgi:hypothetical protein